MAESGTPSKDPSDLQSLPLDKLETKLGTSPETGLTKGDAEQRLAQYGVKRSPRRRSIRFSNSFLISGVRSPG